MSKTRKTPDSSQGEIANGKVRLICGGPCVADGLGCGLGCGATSEWAPIVSPAAPALTRAEQLEDLGWTFDVGFSAMLLGLSVLCPACSRKAQIGSKPEPKPEPEKKP